MARVITFSRRFPVKHPKAGQPTHFVEKIQLSLYNQKLISLSKASEIAAEMGIESMQYIDAAREHFKTILPKGHTIRNGHRFKVGDKFSPRVWSGRPYASKQVVIGPDIEVRKTWDITIYVDYFGPLGLQATITIACQPFYDIEKLAQNDGLSVEDFLAWFAIHPKKTGPQTFEGQIICWDESISY